jgi:hypothetical protein
MSVLVADCPRCPSSRMTFDIAGQVHTSTQFGWQDRYEVFSICRNCHRPTIFVLSLTEIGARGDFAVENGLVKFPNSLNLHFTVERPITLRDNATAIPPDHLPDEIASAFKEGAACLSIDCYNAAGAMFRLCLDLATRPLLPDSADGTKPQPNPKQRRDLGLRLRWLFEKGLLTREVEPLAKCIREDGNDGAHVGNLSKDDADDILDFTVALLERLYTMPRRLELAEERRTQRRSPDQGGSSTPTIILPAV